ncbi:MAG: hypothetical protein NC033_05825 [Clostridiales bacterium]|nr:hypothetical protein [Clostridiales bacterium]
MSEKTEQAKNKIKQKVAEKRKAVKSTVAKIKGNGANTVTSNKLEMLVTVVSRNKGEYYADLIQSFDVNLQVIALANGTADAKTLRYLGLADSEKSVIFSVVQQDKLPDALHTLEEKFNTVKGGKGIAYTIPLSSIVGKLIFGFLSNNRTVVKEENK